MQTKNPPSTPGSGPDIIEAVALDIATMATAFPAGLVASVVADLQQRAAVGVTKYGHTLRAHNGRSALLDCYEEQLDAAAYCRQAQEERPDDQGLLSIYGVILGLALNLKKRLDAEGIR